LIVERIVIKANKNEKEGVGKILVDILLLLRIRYKLGEKVRMRLL